MKQLFSQSFTILFMVSLISCISASATIFDVNSIANTNTGTGTSGTLKYCISQANLTPGPHSINFSVAGTININSSSALLPVLTQQIAINATTAPGYSGVPVVILDGAGSSGGNGLEITAANCEVYGLDITNFSGRGIFINGNAADNFVIGAPGKGNVIRQNNYHGIAVDGGDDGIIAYNKIGTDASGAICAGNGYDGLDFINAANNNQVLFNHISCNEYNGIQIGGSGNNVIKGNVVGPLNGECQGNLYRGIDIEDNSNNNIVGGSNPADFNKIAGNLYYGIEVKNSSTNNMLSGNSYLCNNYGAIALNYGGNNGMQAPYISTATTTIISGTASANATIEIFKSQNTNPTQCTGTPSSQGADFLGSTSADAGGAWSLGGTFGGYVIATATDADGNTSAFSSSVNTGSTDTLENECSGNILSITASFNPSATTVCEKQCIDFTDQSQNAAAWQWYFEGGTPSTSSVQNPAGICYSEPGVFPVKLVVYDANEIDSSTAILYITVNATPPIPEITQVDDTLISSAAVSYQWYLNSVIINGATNQQYVILQNGFYYVEITDSVGCTSISPAMYIDITSVAAPVDSWIELQATHEPSAFRLLVYGMAGLEGYLFLYDLYGRPLMKERLTINTPLFVHTVHTPGVATGAYFIQLVTEGRCFTKKLILQSNY